MLIKHRGFEPLVDASVFVAQTAVLVGKITVKKDSRIMYGAILDSEGSRVEIGECAIICENAVIRATASGDKEYPVLIRDHVFIGPHATLLGCIVEPCSYVATGATILQGATVNSGAIIAVGALVHANTVIPKNLFVPPNTVAIGDPVKIYSPAEKEAMVDAIKTLCFSKIAFAVDPEEDPYSRLKHITKVRSDEFGVHIDDDVL